MAVAVSEMFADYERDFIKLQQELDDHIGDGDAEKYATGADQALRQMEMEARFLPADTRTALEPKLRQYRNELSERRKASLTARQAANRQALLGSRGGCGEDLEKGGRMKHVKDQERLLDANESLDRATKQLENARSVSLETERIGIDVMSDLRQQREVILHARSNMAEMGEQTSHAKKLLDSMARRAMLNKYLVYVVVVFMTCLVIGTMYLMVAGGGAPQTAIHANVDVNARTAEKIKANRTAVNEVAGVAASEAAAALGTIVGNLIDDDAAANNTMWPSFNQAESMSSPKDSLSVSVSRQTLRDASGMVTHVPT